uniref:Translation initiation factor eIF2B subunit delta n=1 Tax=Trichuris muris TaxID=70415 RepID=A0A5S6R528_TRIMR
MENTSIAVATDAQGSKTKAQLRAERRAIQEAQRAAKAERLLIGNVEGDGSPKMTDRVDSTRLAAVVGSQSPLVGVRVDQNCKCTNIPMSEVPDQFRKLLANGNVPACCEDSDSRIVEIAEAVRETIINFRQSSNKTCPRELDALFGAGFRFLSNDCPLPPSVTTLTKQLNWQLSLLPDSCTETEAKAALLEWLDDFLEQNVKLAAKAVAISVLGILQGMNSKPVVLTYSNSSLVETSLRYVQSQGVHFDAVIIDDVPQSHGFELMKQLVPSGIRCQYALLNGIRHVLSEVKVVLLGAYGVLANGNVLTPMGSCQVAQIAGTHNIPVLVLCQTYKFCEKVMTSSNEVAWSDCEVLPSELVTGLVTEIRILPCTAVPAVLRVKQPV